MEGEEKNPSSLGEAMGIPDQKNEPQNQQSLYRVRTMQDDLERVSSYSSQSPKNSKESLQQTIPPAGESKPPRSRHLLLIAILASSILLLAGGAYVYRSLLFSPPPPAIKRLEPPSPVFGIETTETLTIRDEDRSKFRSILAGSVSSNERSGTFKRILVIIRPASLDLGERYATIEDLFSLFGVKSPAQFSTQVAEPLMVFAYYGANGPELGFLAPVKDRDRVLAAMLRWEETMSRDFQPLFLNESIPPPARAIFEGRSYRNTNYRFLAFTDDGTRGISYMVFPAGKYLVITTSQEGIERVIERLFDSL